MSGPDGESVGKTYAFVSPAGLTGEPTTKPSLEPSSVSDRLPKITGRWRWCGTPHVVVCRVARLIMPTACPVAHPETVNASFFPSALLTSSATCPVVTCGTLSGVSPLGWPWPSMLNRKRCEVQAVWEKAVMAAATKLRSPPSLLTAVKSWYGLGGRGDPSNPPGRGPHKVTAVFGRGVGRFSLWPARKSHRFP